MGITRQIEADTVIFAIGDSVDKDFCLPVYNNGYVTVSAPRYPVDGVSYEAFDPDSGKPVEKVFLAGWARQASTGLVGAARKDGESAAQAILQFLQTQPAMLDVENVFDKFVKRLEETHVHVISKKRLARLEEAERAESQKRGLQLFKFATNEEMFTAIGL